MGKFLDSILRSKPTEKIVHKVVVKKLATGKYLEYMKAKPEIFVSFFDEVFETQSLNEVLSKVLSGDIDEIKTFIIKAVAVVPELVTKVIADLLEADPDYILNELSPKELLEVLTAFAEINDYSGFFLNVKKLLPKKVKVSEMPEN